MPLLLEIFLMFMKLSLFSFGGGYVMFPILMREIENNQIITMNQLADVIAIAGMSPGAVAVNAAVGVGFKAAGIPGAIASFLGIAIPCAMIVIIVATFFFKVCKHHLVKAAFYGLRPVITGIILYASYKIASTNGILLSAADSLNQNGINISFGQTHLLELKSIIIAVAAFLLLIKTKTHPVLIIFGAGVLGVILF